MSLARISLFFITARAITFLLNAGLKYELTATGFVSFSVSAGTEKNYLSASAGYLLLLFF